MTKEQNNRINYLQSEIKRLGDENTIKYHQIEELKKELKRYIDLYIKQIK